MTDEDRYVVRKSIGDIFDMMDTIRRTIAPCMASNPKDLPPEEQFALADGMCTGWRTDSHGGVVMKLRRRSGDFEKSLDDLWVDDMILLGSKAADDRFETVQNAGSKPAEG